MWMTGISNARSGIGRMAVLRHADVFPLLLRSGLQPLRRVRFLVDKPSTNSTVSCSAFGTP